MMKMISLTDAATLVDATQTATITVGESNSLDVILARINFYWGDQ